MTELSVVVPVFNGEKYLKELLDSLLKIQRVTMEIIVVDDGSTDSSKKIVTSYENETIHYFYKENGGVVSARNLGLLKATGNMILFVDQDDKVNPKTIEMSYRLAESHAADAVFFSTQRFDDKGKYKECDTVYQERILDTPEIADRMLRKLITRRENDEELISYVGHLWAAMVRLNLIRKYEISFRFYMSIEDDVLFILDVLDKAGKVVTCPEVGYYWRCNPSSQTFSGKYVENFIPKMMKYYEYRTDILIRHNVCTDKEMTQYLIGMRQEQILNIFNNECLPQNGNVGVSFRQIKALLTKPEYRQAIKEKPECPLAGRCKTEMKLLRMEWLWPLWIYKRIQLRKRFLVNSMRRKFL